MMKSDVFGPLARALLADVAPEVVEDDELHDEYQRLTSALFEVLSNEGRGYYRGATLVAVAFVFEQVVDQIVAELLSKKKELKQ